MIVHVEALHSRSGLVGTEAGSTRRGVQEEWRDLRGWLARLFADH